MNTQWMDYQKLPWEVFCKKGVHKKFAKFTGWRLVQIKLKAFRSDKKTLEQRCFPVKFVKLLRTPILKNICERLLVDYVLPDI